VDTHDVTEDYGTAKWVEREDAHARHVLSTAKLVVTFSSGIAAGFVSAAFQENDKGAWSIVAAALMLLALRQVFLSLASSVAAAIELFS
jgi:hypothetical protein